MPFDKKSVYISDGTSKSYRIGMRYSLEGKWDRETGVQFGNIFFYDSKKLDLYYLFEVEEERLGAMRIVFHGVEFAVDPALD